MTKSEIKPFLLAGKRVRRKTWKPGRFLFVENDTVYDSATGRPWHNDGMINSPEFTPKDHEDWEIL